MVEAPWVENEPMTATTCSSTNWRAQVPASLGFSSGSQKTSSSGRSLSPPSSLTERIAASAAETEYGKLMPMALPATGAYIPILIGSPVAPPAPAGGVRTRAWRSG